jgi:hypothetical protein
MAVGEICCDRFTESTLASDCRKFGLRKESFINSARWASKKDGSQTIVQMNELMSIMPFEGNWQIVIDGYKGKKVFKSRDAAKSMLFDLIETGDVKKYLTSKRKTKN